MSEAVSAARPASPIFHAVTHVWGRDYLDVFLNVCVPNQLAPGNVPALPAGSRYRILTRSMHVAELDAHPMIAALRAVIPVDIVVVAALDRDFTSASGHELMIACHRRAIDDALDAAAALIVLSADLVFSDNALAAVVQRHREGYRAVVSTGLRLRKESFRRHLQASQAPLAAMSSRALVAMALPHLHPHTESMIAGSPAFSRSPVAVFWPVGQQGLLGRCLHLHPLMIDPLRWSPLGEETIDGPYLARACPDAARVHVVTDSDELQMFELTAAEREVVPTTGGGVSAWRAAIMAAKCDTLQLHYWQQHPVRIHAGELGAEWDAAGAVADTFARGVMRRRPYSSLARRWYRAVGGLRKRSVRYGKAVRRQRRRLRVERLERWAARQARLVSRYRPRLRVKGIQRSVRVWMHTLTKAGRLQLKRIRRLRLFKPAYPGRP